MRHYGMSAREADTEKKRTFGSVELLTHEEALIDPECHPGCSVVDHKADGPRRRRVRGSLQKAAVHGEARKLSGQLEHMVLQAVLVTHEGLNTNKARGQSGPDGAECEVYPTLI